MPPKKNKAKAKKVHSVKETKKVDPVEDIEVIEEEKTEDSTLNEPSENPGVPDYVKEIDEILGGRVIGGQLHYVVRWKNTTEKASEVHGQVSELLDHYQLRNRIGRNIRIISYRIIEDSSEDMSDPKYDVTQHFLFMIAYKKNEQTYVSYKFMELYFPKELILFLMPILACPEALQIRPIRFDLDL
ncbi:hypothetical protein L596_001256 [Steinernema carpocapsae]|uniref:Chromo domain-containing protein n=1 Tax=Steinernema carpocapsae TaxID=34508 RepID=A0A4U8UKQ8_STECR|nr:hypothetical protein L596_001256 [Steinernema carpocapsae]